MQDCHGIQRTFSGLRKRLSNSTLSKTRNDIDNSLSSVTSPSAFRRSGRSCLAMQDSHGIKTNPSSSCSETTFCVETHQLILSHSMPTNQEIPGT